MSLYFCFNPLHPNCTRKCYCGPRCLHCVSAYLRIGGCASGRRQAQARCTWSGVWAPGLTAPARPRVSPATAGTLAAGSRQLWGDSRLDSIGDSAVTSDGVTHEASQHDAVHYSEKTLTTVLSVKCSLRHWVNTLKQVTRVSLLWWCISDCALWMPLLTWQLLQCFV